MNSDNLQAIARKYLSRLRYMANKHGLGVWVDTTIADNRNGRCKATENEVRMLSRLCNDSNVKRTDVPKILEKSYRYCVETGVFERLKTNISNRATYDKVSVLMLGRRLSKKTKKRRNE